MPWRTLLILDLCRRIINTERTMLNNIKARDSLKISIYIGRASAVSTEATEIILTIINTTNQVKIAKPTIIFKPAIFIARPINTPKVVATPLPPLNPKNMVQLWPEIALRPKITRSISGDRNVTR